MPVLMIMGTIILLGCATAPSKKARTPFYTTFPTDISAEASGIVTPLKTTCALANHGLPRARALPPDFPEQITITGDGIRIDLASQGGRYETVIVTPQAVSDGFTYTVYLDHTRKLYWIRESGGITGGTQLWGPGSFNENKENGVEPAGGAYVAPEAGAPSAHP